MRSHRASEHLSTAVLFITQRESRRVALTEKIRSYKKRCGETPKIISDPLIISLRPKAVAGNISKGRVDRWEDGEISSLTFPFPNNFRYLRFV
jgi:hypothetical protein